MIFVLLIVAAIVLLAVGRIDIAMALTLAALVWLVLASTGIMEARWR